MQTHDTPVDSPTPIGGPVHIDRMVADGATLRLWDGHNGGFGGHIEFVSEGRPRWFSCGGLTATYEVVVQHLNDMARRYLAGELR